MKVARMCLRRSALGLKLIPEKLRSQLSRNGATLQQKSLDLHQLCLHQQKAVSLNQRVLPHANGQFRPASVTQAATSMSTSVDPAYQNVQQSVNEQLRLAIVTQVVLSTMTYVESVSLHMSHKVQHVPVSVPVLLPLESATQAVMSLLVYVVLVFQLAQESVR